MVAINLFLHGSHIQRTKEVALVLFTIPENCEKERTLDKYLLLEVQREGEDNSSGILIKWRMLNDQS